MIYQESGQKNRNAKGMAYMVKHMLLIEFAYVFGGLLGSTNISILASKSLSNSSKLDLESK